MGSCQQRQHRGCCCCGPHFKVQKGGQRQGGTGVTSHLSLFAERCRPLCCQLLRIPRQMPGSGITRNWAWTWAKFACCARAVCGGQCSPEKHRGPAPALCCLRNVAAYHNLFPAPSTTERHFQAPWPRCSSWEAAGRCKGFGSTLLLVCVPMSAGMPARPTFRPPLPPPLVLSRHSRRRLASRPAAFPAHPPAPLPTQPSPAAHLPAGDTPTRGAAGRPLGAPPGTCTHLQGKL